MCRVRPWKLPCKVERVGFQGFLLYFKMNSSTTTFNNCNFWYHKIYQLCRVENMSEYKLIKSNSILLYGFCQRKLASPKVDMDWIHLVRPFVCRRMVSRAYRKLLFWSCLIFVLIGLFFGRLMVELVSVMGTFTRFAFLYPIDGRWYIIIHMPKWFT